MRKILITSIIYIFFAAYTKAMPAYPKKVQMIINGIEMQIRLFGDEYNKRVEKEDGHTIIQNDSGDWMYAILNEKGSLASSSFKVGTNSPELSDFLSSIPLHLSEKTQSVKKIIQRTPKQPAIGQRRILVILMEFPDKKFTKKKIDFENLFNQDNYREDGAKGSVKDYFIRSSYGQMVLSCDVFGPYQTSKAMSAYGGNKLIGGGDKDPTALFEEAINKVADEIDLLKYDGDKDGYVDNVHIVYSGYGEEAGGPTSAIWAHEGSFVRPYEIQGVKIDRYSCAPELRSNSGTGISRIGPHCHEIGHALGAMDFYDTNYSDGGQYLGTGDWDLMASGSWNNDGITPADINPFVKAYNYGWIDLHNLPEGNVTISPSYIDKENYYMINNLEDIYIFENRSPLEYNDGLPGKGLLIFHIHPDIDNVANNINVSSPQMCYVVCASNKKDGSMSSANDYGDINSAGCPFPGSSQNNSFSALSFPRAFWWNGDNCNISIHNIELSVDNHILFYNENINNNTQDLSKTRIYFEDFEKNEGGYSIIETEKNRWERVKSTNNIVDAVKGRPKAYKGEYYVLLTAMDNINDITSQLLFECSPTSENISHLQLSGYFISKGLSKNNSNIITIYWNEEGDDNLNYYDLEVSVNNVWTPFLVNIPTKGKTKIIIEGKVHSSSALALDYLQVEQLCLTNISSNTNSKSIEKIYNINGVKTPKVFKGINIIKYENGEIKKVFKRF